MSAGYGVGGPQAYDLEQTLALLEEMRTVLDNEDPATKILMTDVNSPSDITAFYGENVTDQVGSLSQMPMRDTFLPDALTADNVIFNAISINYAVVHGGGPLMTSDSRRGEEIQNDPKKLGH